MTEKIIHETDFLLAWFATWASTTICGFVAGFFAGFIAGATLSLLGVTDKSMLVFAGGAAGTIVGIPISYLFFRLFVGKLIVGKFTRRLKAETEGMAG